MYLAIIAPSTLLHSRKITSGFVLLFFFFLFFKDRINCTTICQRRSRGMQSRRCACNGKKNGIISERADSFFFFDRSSPTLCFRFPDSRSSLLPINLERLSPITLYSFTRVFSDFPRLATDTLSSLQCVRIESRVIFHDRTRDRSPVSLTFFSRYFIGSSLLVFLFFFLCILASVAWRSCEP